MRVFLAGFALCTLGCLSASGQGDLIRVRAGRSFKEEFPDKIRYRFPKFQRSFVTYTNGKVAPVRPMNYDILYEGILTVQITGDTVAIDDQPHFSAFHINDVTYQRIAKDRYLEIIEENEKGKIAVREHFIIKRRDRKSNDGYSVAIDNTNSVYSIRNQGYGRMVLDQDLLMTKQSIYYIFDKYGNSYKSSRSKFQRVFPGHKSEINKYLNEHYTDFQSREAILRLFDYCSTLSEKDQHAQGHASR